MRVASGTKSSTETPAAQRSQGKPIDLMFMYLGRRGALGRFTLELAQCAAKLEGLQSRIVVSQFGELTEEIKRTGAEVLELPTFEGRNPVALVRNFLWARNALIEEIKRKRPAAVITLCRTFGPPYSMKAIKRRGVLYASITHDVCRASRRWHRCDAALVVAGCQAGRPHAHLESSRRGQAAHPRHRQGGKNFALCFTPTSISARSAPTDAEI